MLLLRAPLTYSDPHRDMGCEYVVDKSAVCRVPLRIQSAKMYFSGYKHARMRKDACDQRQRASSPPVDVSPFCQRLRNWIERPCKAFKARPLGMLVPRSEPDDTLFLSQLGWPGGLTLFWFRLSAVRVHEVLSEMGHREGEDVSRPRKPAVLMQQAFKAHPSRYREDAPSTGAFGDPPSYFGNVEREIWEGLRYRAPWLTNADEYLAEAFCALIATFRQRGIGGPDGVTPAFISQLTIVSTRLGLAATERSKVSFKKKEEVKNPFLELDSDESLTV